MKKKMIVIITLLMLMFGIRVEACEITLEEYRKLDVYNSYVVGEYMFDTSSGFAPSLEDFATAARTIPDGEPEYLYSILDVPLFGEYRVREVFENTVSEDETKFPYLDLTYNYRANIRGASKEDYDIFTCKSDSLKVNYTALFTEGEGEYKTNAIRYVSVSSTDGIKDAKYCITTEEKCTPRIEKEITENPGIMEIEYETNANAQRVCVEVKDNFGNTSDVICDDTTVKVDKEAASVEATDNLSNVIEGEPHGVENLFLVNYSVSGGKKNHYYYLEESGEKTKYLLTNLSDLPSGDVEVEVMVRGGNGLVSKEDRIITVEKSKVTYDYKTNGGVSVAKEYDEVIYQGRADLSIQAVKDGYEFVGWNTDKSANYGLEYLEVTENTTLYAIFKKDITAYFEITLDGNKVPAVSEYDDVKCTLYNNEEKCKINISEISAKVGYEALGWNIEKNKETALYTGKEEVEINKDTTYYSVTRKKTGISGTFNVYKNGTIKKEIIKCYLYNGEDTCKIDTSEINSEDYNGRKFIGFTSDVENVSKEDKIIELDQGKEFYAYYEDTYDIKYISGEKEEELDTAHVYFIMKLTGVVQNVEEKVIKDLKDKDGYTKSGWRSDKNNLEPELNVNDKIKIKEDTIYYGVYEKQVKVTYTSDNTTQNIPNPSTGQVYQNVGSDTLATTKITINEAKEISKDQYLFVVWKSDNSSFDPGSEIELSEDITLEAEWTLNGCIIILDYETNGGTKADKSSITYINGNDAIDLSKVKAYKSGWTFIGWGVDKDSKANPFTTYKPENGVKEVTLYAMYKKTLQVSYRILDDIAFNMSTNANMSYEIYNRETSYEITMPTVNKVKTNYEFLGWSTKSDTEEKEYSVSEKVKINNNTVFYGISKNTVALKSTYKYYDGNTYKEKVESCYRYNKSDTCETKTAISGMEYNTGILRGWSKTSDVITEAEKQIISKDTSFYGIYDRVLSVTYNSGIAGITKPMTSHLMNYLVKDNGIIDIGATIVMEEADGISGYTTAGWRKDKLAKEAEYKVGSTQIINDDQVYYAVYKKNIEISYASMGGIESRSNEVATVFYNSSMNSIEVKHDFVLADALTRVGYDFSGWLVENNIDDKYQPGETITLTKNTKMYATWTPKKYLVTYDYLANGGASVSQATATVSYLSNINLNPTATKAGYEFVGWNTDVNAKVALSEMEMPAEDVILYAIFRKKLTATWELTDINAGTIEESQTTCYKYNNDPVCQVESGNLIANSGYSALGWSKVKGSIEVAAGNDIFTDIGVNTTFYSVTRKTAPLVATYYYNVGTTITTKTANCVLYNGATSCSVKSPIKPLLYKTVPFVGWSSQKESYVAASNTINKNTKYYAYYTQVLEITYYEGATNAMTSYTNPIKYILSESGEYASIPSITIKTPTSLSNYSTLGWREDLTKGEATQLSNKTISYTESHTYYAVYKRTLTLSYNANQGSGSIASQTATQYYNASSGCTSHTFKLAAGSAMSRTGWTFIGWLQDSASGTKYNAQTNITVNKDTVMYANWQLNKYTVTLTGSNVTYQNTGGTAISSIDVYYGKTAQFKAVPGTGYYFQSISCTNGYTVSGLSTGTAHYTTQTVTVSNPNVLSGATCTISMHLRNYAATATYVPKTCSYESCGSSYCCEWSWDGGNPNNIDTQYCVRDGCRDCDTVSYDCSYYSYSCPQGGTLSGTTCVF